MSARTLLVSRATAMRLFPAEVPRTLTARSFSVMTIPTLPCRRYDKTFPSTSAGVYTCWGKERVGRLDGDMLNAALRFSLSRRYEWWKRFLQKNGIRGSV